MTFTLALLLLPAQYMPQHQETQTRNTSPAAQPTKVVTRSDRLVTAHVKGGGTLSFNCKKPENRSKKVCAKSR